MPQKAIYGRKPLVTCSMSVLSNGQARTDDERTARLYEWACGCIDEPEVWEGTFSLACLTRDDPMKEPVTEKILAALSESTEGALPGGWKTQLQTARAALAVYEYCLDKSIPARLASWCGEMELKWDEAAAEQSFRVCPADLMSFLVRFYRVTGMKTALRLCARLRSAAMDWTTILHSFHQRQPLSKVNSADEISSVMSGEVKDETDFLYRQYLTNHAELFADGARYTVWSGIFSGNGQDMSACEKGWHTVSRDHGAVCGGTTGDVLLAGRGTDKGIYAAAQAAWTEAFISQASVSGAPWALNALTRLAFNGMPACIGKNGPVIFQRANTLTDDPGSAGCFDPQESKGQTAHVIGRLARAWAAMYRSAVMPDPEGFSVNLPLEGRFALSAGREPISVRMEKDRITIRAPKGLKSSIRLYMADTETRTARATMGDKTAVSEENAASEGAYLVMSGDGSTDCGINLDRSGRLAVMDTHHEGVCCFEDNRLMAADTGRYDYSAAACGEPETRTDRAVITVKKVSKWNSRAGIPADIPVLPSAEGEPETEELTAYADTPCRIAVFPRAMS